MSAKSRNKSDVRKPARGSLPPVKFQFMTTGEDLQVFKVDSIGRKTRVVTSSAPKASAAKPAAAKAKAGKARPARAAEPKSKTRKATPQVTLLDSNPFKRGTCIQVVVRKPSRRS